MWKIGEKWRCGMGKKGKEKASGSGGCVKMKSLTPLRHTSHTHTTYKTTSNTSQQKEIRSTDTSDPLIVQKAKKNSEKIPRPPKAEQKITSKTKKKKRGAAAERLKIHHHRPEQYHKSQRQLKRLNGQKKHYIQQPERGVPPRKIFAPKAQHSGGLSDEIQAKKLRQLADVFRL